MPIRSCTQFILDPELADAIIVNRIAVLDGSKCHIYRLLLTNLSVSSQCRTSSAVLSLRSQRDPALPFCPSSSTPVPALPGSDELASYCFKALVSVCLCVCPSSTCRASVFPVQKSSTPANSLSVHL